MRFIIAVLALFGFSGHALAWGDLGHTIVCEIAFRLAQPHTRTAIQLLIRNDPQFRNFARSCTFPDHPRKRVSEHFVNLPRHFQGVTPANPCPGAQRCTLTAIPNDLQLLSARTTRPQDKLVALKFLGHWVGDIHQPMHISFEDDRGGNDISVSGRCSGSLHSTWDTCLVQKAVGSNPTQAATALIAAITPQMRQQWIASGPFEWANESYQIARAPTTKYCVIQGMSCVLPVPPRVTADNAYVAINAPIVQMRLQQAGVRLADLLDRAFGN